MKKTISICLMMGLLQGCNPANLSKTGGDNAANNDKQIYLERIIAPDQSTSSDPTGGVEGAPVRSYHVTSISEENHCLPPKMCPDYLARRDVTEQISVEFRTGSHVRLKGSCDSIFGRIELVDFLIQELAIKFVEEKDPKEADQIIHGCNATSKDVSDSIDILRNVNFLQLQEAPDVLTLKEENKSNMVLTRSLRLERDGIVHSCKSQPLVACSMALPEHCVYTAPKLDPDGCPVGCGDVVCSVESGSGSVGPGQVTSSGSN